MRDWETAQPAAISSQAVSVTCRVLTKPCVPSILDFMCCVAQGPITKVSTSRCVYVLNWDVLHWDQFPTALAVLVCSVEPGVESFGLCVCSPVHWGHPLGWGFVMLLWSSRYKGRSVQGVSEVLQALHHLLL